MQAGEYAQAIGQLSSVLQADPKSAAAFRGLAYCHAKLGNWQKALMANLSCLGHDGNKVEDLEMLLNIVAASNLDSYVDLIEASLKVAMKHPQLVKQASVLLAVQFKAKYRAIFTSKTPSMLSSFASMLRDESLRQLLKTACMTDYTFENLLLTARYELLQGAAVGHSIVDYRYFLSALVSQTLLNDGLYHTAEKDLLLLEQMKSNNTVEAVLLRMCYADFATAMTLFESHKAELQASGLTELVADFDFYVAVMANSQAGAAVKIKDKTSKAVQSFYQQHPYPKYKAIQSSSAGLKQIFTYLGKTMPTAPTVLIAGCGTGKHAIELAIMHPEMKMTAIDLSPVSIAYAQLMAKRFGLRNIEFKVLDILDIASLEQSFDYIACTGVLHHMKKPQLGLNALSAVLKADGVMNLSFYSKAARKGLASIKAKALTYLETKDVGVTPEGVRRWRSQLSAEDRTSRWFSTGEFFALNGLYQQLFHPQQSEYSAIELESLLNAAELKFAWMPVSEPNMMRFKAAFAQYPVPEGGESLTYWNEFEKICPDYFFAQFQFFVLK